MTDWVPVLIMAFVVVCVTAYVVGPETPSTKKRPLVAGPFQQPTTSSSHWISGYSGVLPPSPGGAAI